MGQLTTISGYEITSKQLLRSAESTLHCVSFPNSLPPNAVIGGSLSPIETLGDESIYDERLDFCLLHAGMIARI